MSNKLQKLLIGGRTFKVQWHDVSPLDQRLAGRCDLTAQTIHVLKGQHYDEARDTLLHEVLHAIAHIAGLDIGQEAEERAVRTLASGLIGVFNANPAFADWVVGK